MTEGRILISKLASAQRQLDAAIRMTFAEEDILAVTTVAAAAYRVLRDIKETRGQKVFAHHLRDGVLGVARAYARGELEANYVRLFQQSDQFWSLITEAVQRIRAAGADRDISELRSLLNVEVARNVEKHHWKQKNTAANFLKHPDFDPKSFLSTEEVNASNLMMEACDVYFDLMGSVTIEMEVWMAAMFLNHKVSCKHPAIVTIMEFLRAIPPEEYNRSCLALVQKLKQNDELPPRDGPL